MTSLRASRAACVASIVGARAAEVPLDEAELRAWLGERGLGLTPVAEPASFAWAGPWIARRGERAVVMFGVPSGVVYDPAGAGETPIDEGWVISALDVALWERRDGGVDAGVGVVEEILVAEDAGAPIVALEQAHAIAGRGLEGDRHVDGRGTFGPGPGHALTLIEREVVDELGLDGPTARRNVVTRGIRLNALVGKTFTVGDVRCAGRRLCEPCAHLDRLAGGGILRPLVHRAGLRADILTDGHITLGDAVAAD